MLNLLRCLWAFGEGYTMVKLHGNTGSVPKGRDLGLKVPFKVCIK